jgi:hypothetical protein
MINSPEWQHLEKILKKRFDELFRMGRKRDPKLNELKYTERDLIFAQMEMIELFLEDPDKYLKLNEQYAKSTIHET